MDTFERDYWGDCTNTFDEEQKHFVYARLMGIPVNGYSFAGQGRRVLDIGGGPVSMLLKTHSTRQSYVLDPLMDFYPQWVRDRYKTKRVLARGGRAENLTEYFHTLGWSDGPPRLDEVWIYNVLQHVDDPEKVLHNARSVAPVLRIFEWLDIPPHAGHPHMLTDTDLNRWIGSKGTVVQLNESGCVGKAYGGCLPFVR